MPYAMCGTVMGFYLSLFLLEVALVSAKREERREERKRDEGGKRQKSFCRNCLGWLQCLLVQKIRLPMKNCLVVEKCDESSPEI